jgi:hypothetical protein
MNTDKQPDTDDHELAPTIECLRIGRTFAPIACASAARKTSFDPFSSVSPGSFASPR